MGKSAEKTAVAYLRVSGRGQVDGHGFDRQAETIAAWGKHTGTTITATYREAGVSGSNDESQRPAFAEMVSDLLSNCCRTVVVESLDRFARDLGVQMQLLAYLAAKKITLISASTGDDITAAIEDDPMRKAMVQIQGVFAELDKNTTVRKLRKARERVRAEKGKCEGPKHFGELPGELKTLARIKELSRKPKGREARSPGEIARILTAEGLPTRTGKPWSKQAVAGIIKRGFGLLKQACMAL